MCCAAWETFGDQAGQNAQPLVSGPRAGLPRPVVVCELLVAKSLGMTRGVRSVSYGAIAPSRESVALAADTGMISQEIPYKGKSLKRENPLYRKSLIRGKPLCGKLPYGKPLQSRLDRGRRHANDREVDRYYAQSIVVIIALVVIIVIN